MRAALFAIGAIGIFTVFVTVFAASAQARSVRVLPKWIWVFLCVFVTPVGGILYLTLGRPLGTDEAPAPSAKPRGQRAPDDDPEFLRNLARRLRDEKDGK